LKTAIFTVTLPSLITLPLTRQHDDATTRRRDVKPRELKIRVVRSRHCRPAAAAGRQWQGREIWDHKHRRCLF